MLEMLKLFKLFELFELLQMVPKLIELIYWRFGIWYGYVCEMSKFKWFVWIVNLSRAKLQNWLNMYNWISPSLDKLCWIICHTWIKFFYELWYAWWYVWHDMSDWQIIMLRFANWIGIVIYHEKFEELFKVNPQLYFICDLLILDC